MLISGPVGAPEGLHGEVLRYGRVTNDPQDPAMDVALELPEECLESLELAAGEPLQQLHCPL